MADNDDWFPLAELTRRLAQLIWVERQLADVLEAWSRIEADTDASIAMRVAAGHHRWHADVLASCQPSGPALAPDAACTPPTPGWERAIETLVQLTDPDQTTARLNVIVRELDPWLERECDALQTLLRPIADAAVLRWLRFITDDHDRDSAPLTERLSALQANTVKLGDRVVLDLLDLRGRSTGPATLG